jgi:hypothetical protein
VKDLTKKLESMQHKEKDESAQLMQVTKTNKEKTSEELRLKKKMLELKLA